MCIKRKYNAEYEAKRWHEALVLLSPVPQKPNTPYLCKECGYWHLTSKKQ